MVIYLANSPRKSPVTVKMSLFYVNFPVRVNILRANYLITNYFSYNK